MMFDYILDLLQLINISVSSVIVKVSDVHVIEPYWLTSLCFKVQRKVAN